MWLSIFQNYDPQRHAGRYKCLITNPAGQTGDEEAKSLDLVLDSMY